MRERAKGGLTLAELVLAIMLLGLLIVSVLSLFLGLLTSSAKSNDQAIGVVYADRLLQDIAGRARKTHPSFNPSYAGNASFYTQDTENLTQFAYTVTATELTPGVGRTGPAGEFANSDPAGPGASWLLEAEVRWWSTEQARSKAGSGQLFVRQSRVVYVSR